MRVIALRCPSCGAPVRVTGSECSYCRTPLVFEDGEARPTDGAAAPDAEARAERNAGRASRLARALDEAGGRALFDRGRAAWEREAQVGRDGLDPDAKADATALSGMLATAYAAALEAPEIGPARYDDRVAALWTLVDGVLDQAVLERALETWEASLESEGVEGFARRLANSLPSAEARRASFALAAAAAAEGGGLTSSDEEVLEALADWLGLDEDDAVGLAERAARPL